MVSYDGEEFLLIEVEPLESGKMNPQKEGHRSGRYNIAGGAYLSEKKGCLWFEIEQWSSLPMETA